MNHKYKFSVVVPIYNAEKYLKETIESVINQTIGFKENIQLILVNDGSADGSERICLKYEKQYPENIVYIKQKNAGVSAARNKGMKYIEGEYVNFLDSDDKWDLDAFKIMEEFFAKNKEIEIAVGRMKFFEAREDHHLLDYKFEKTKIVNILENYDFIHLHITSSVIKAELAKKYKFNEKLKYGEDANYVNEIILEKQKFGVIREAKHYYRKRLDESSAVQNKEKSKQWYIETIQYFYDNIIDLSIKKFGRVIPYIQYLITYDLQWRIKGELPNVLNSDEEAKYVGNLSRILNMIEDYIIIEQNNSNSEQKIFMLKLKYNKDITKELQYVKGELYFRNLPIYKIRNNKSICKLDILEINGDKLNIEGRIHTPLNREDYNIYIKINKDEKILLKLEDGKKSIYQEKDFALNGKKLVNNYTYKATIPLKDVKKIRFIFSYKDEIDNRLTPKMERFSKLANIPHSYYTNGKYIILFRKKNLIVKEQTKIKKIKRELKYDYTLIRKKEIGIIFVRYLYYICKLFRRKEIWLVSDRENKIDDNGEVFFRYLQKQKNKNIKCYFLINGKCNEYKKMKKVGRVIKNHTLKHKIYFLMCSKIVSSQANDYVINPFKEKEIYYRNLMNFKFIFLQHGIIKDDLSGWLKKYDKNIKIFVTSAKTEYDSILKGDYYYTKNEIKLTGLPRYDRLENKKEKSIIIIPTHRRNLVEWNPKNKMDNSYNPYFKRSTFYKFYNDLINDKRIIEELKNSGYKLKFALHPLMEKQAVDFTGNEYTEIIKGKVDYHKEFAENALLITDYSSVAFDFAYLKKPIIYTQFDKDNFYEGQVYEKGYFDYERDGMGPVCYDYESTVEEIVNYIKNDCKFDDEYLQRAKKFYYKFDKNNCKRVYEEILKL